MCHCASWCELQCDFLLLNERACHFKYAVCLWALSFGDFTFTLVAWEQAFSMNVWHTCALHACKQTRFGWCNANGDRAGPKQYLWCLDALPFDLRLRFIPPYDVNEFSKYHCLLCLFKCVLITTTLLILVKKKFFWDGNCCKLTPDFFPPTETFTCEALVCRFQVTDKRLSRWNHADL